MTLGAILAFLVFAAIFISLNILAWKALTRFHPRFRRLFLVVFAVSNALWLVLPWVLIARTNPLIRLLRATFGPPWFFWLMWVLLYAGLLAVVTICWLPFRRRVPWREFGRRPSAAFLLFTLVFCVVGFYHAVVPLRVETPEIIDARLPAQLDGMKIVLLSDTHVGLFTRMSRLEEIARIVNELKPAVVAISGDMIDDDPFWVPKLLEGFRSIEAPIVGVLGNHEIYGDPEQVIEKMRGSRIRLLVNEGFPLERDGATLWIAGISDYAAAQRNRTTLAPDLDRALRGRPDGAFVVGLAHQPKIFAEAVEREIPLSLAGHTHGGQCGIRPLGISLAGLFLEYHMGLYRKGSSQLYINTGTGYWLVPLRFGMTPEITAITLRRR